jgi:hypothetical protein
MGGKPTRYAYALGGDQAPGRARAQGKRKVTIAAGTSIGNLIVAAFGLSRSNEPKLNERWIWMSHRIGSKLPRSLLSVAIQRLGEVDLVCRALESEMLSQPPREGELDLRFNYLVVLSEWWISSAYAICFTLKDRKILDDPEFLTLADDLRMIRVQNEKFELPSDRKLTEPLKFSPAKLRPDEKEAPIYVYDKTDPLRAHIAQKGLSTRRSLVWEVFIFDTKMAKAVGLSD